MAILAEDSLREGSYAYVAQYWYEPPFAYASYRSGSVVGSWKQKGTQFIINTCPSVFWFGPKIADLLIWGYTGLISSRLVCLRTREIVDT